MAFERITHTHDLKTEGDEYGTISHTHAVNTELPPHAHILACGQAYVSATRPLGAVDG